MVDLPSMDDEIAVLIKRCEADQDPVILALALAHRAERRLNSGSVLAQQEGDRDLARATAILETAQGGALELVTALGACAGTTSPETCGRSRRSFSLALSSCCRSVRSRSENPSSA